QFNFRGNPDGTSELNLTDRRLIRTTQFLTELEKSALRERSFLMFLLFCKSCNIEVKRRAVMASEPRSRLELIPGSDGPRDISALQLATLAIFGERVGRHSGQVPRPRLLDYLEEELEGPRPDNLDSVKFKPVNALQRSMTVWLVQLHPARLFNLGRDLSRLAGDTEVTRDLAD